MPKFIFLFFMILMILVILFSPFISSLKVGISPPKIELSGKPEQELCKEITVYSDKKITLEAEDLWTLVRDSKNLKDYNLSSEELGITTKYDKEISVNSNKKVKFCADTNKEDVYNGVLVYKSVENSAGVGIWIKLKTGKEQFNVENVEDSQNSITGNVIKTGDNEIENKLSPLVFPFALCFLALGLGLFILIRKMKENRSKII